MQQHRRRIRETSGGTTGPPGPGPAPRPARRSTLLLAVTVIALVVPSAATAGRTAPDDGAGEAASGATGGTVSATQAVPDGQRLRGRRTAADERAGSTARNTPAVRSAARAAPSASCAPPTADGVQLSEGIPTPEGRHSASTGTLRALTLMIDFPDVPGDGSARGRFAEFFPRTSEWYATSSYGALDYKASAPVERWLRMPRSFASYGIERGAGYEPGYRRLIRDIARTADRRVDFSAYDLVNVLVTPNAGPPAVETVLSVTFSGTPRPPKADGVPLDHVSFVYSRQDDGTPEGKANAYRVLPHENAHALGLPDLYTTGGDGRAGHWDLMSETWGPGNDFLGWHKRKLGWLDGRQIACANGSGGSEHVIGPLARAGQDGGAGRDGKTTRLVYVPVTDSAGYAVEVRTQEGNDDVVCKPGALVYWVDTRTASGAGPVTVRDSTPRSDGCARRPNMNAELSDAPFGVGQRMTDRKAGIGIEVTGRDRASGGYRIRVTRP